MSDELCDPAENVDQAHEPELAHAQVQFVTVLLPFLITQDHGREPPCHYTSCYPPIHKEIGKTDESIRNDSESDFITEKGHLETELEEWHDVAQLDIPGVDYDGDEDHVDDLVDDVVVELPVVKHHVLHVHALLITPVFTAKFTQLFFYRMFLSSLFGW